MAADEKAASLSAHWRMSANAGARTGGEGGIRTLGTPQGAQRFSRPPRSTTLAPLRKTEDPSSKGAETNPGSEPVATAAARAHDLNLDRRGPPAIVRPLRTGQPRPFEF
jgi:hypothetical protein